MTSKIKSEATAMEISKHIGLIQWLRGCKTTSTVCVSILSQHESVVGGGSGKQLIILWFSYPNQEKSDTFHNSGAIGAIHQRFFETSNPDWLTYPQTRRGYQHHGIGWLLLSWSFGPTIFEYIIALVCFELILPYQHHKMHYRGTQFDNQTPSCEKECHHCGMAKPAC